MRFGADSPGPFEVCGEIQKHKTGDFDEVRELTSERCFAIDDIGDRRDCETYCQDRDEWKQRTDSARPQGRVEEPHGERGDQRAEMSGFVRFEFAVMPEDQHWCREHELDNPDDAEAQPHDPCHCARRPIRFERAHDPGNGAVGVVPDTRQRGAPLGGCHGPLLHVHTHSVAG